MSICDDHDDIDRIQLTAKNVGSTSDFENVGQQRTVEYQCTSSSSGEDSRENSLVVNSSTLETQGESPKCMYHLMSPTVPANTPVDPRFSSVKPPRVRMILPELNRGTYLLLIECNSIQNYLAFKL